MGRAKATPKTSALKSAAASGMMRSAGRRSALARVMAARPLDLSFETDCHPVITATATATAAEATVSAQTRWHAAAGQPPRRRLHGWMVISCRTSRTHRLGSASETSAALPGSLATAPSTFVGWALTTHAGDLVRVVDLVVLKHMKFHLLLSVLHFLWFGVSLLLTLLATTTHFEHKVKGGFLLDVVILEGAAILKLLASEDETLLVWGDSLLVLNLGLDGFDCVSALNLKGDGFSCECLHKDLHDFDIPRFSHLESPC